MNPGEEMHEPVDHLANAAARRVGDVLNEKWRLDQLLGVGGMAAVFAATHRNGNRVAVKLLHPHCAAIDTIRSRFQREGYVANMIEHPGAVRVLDDDRTPDGAVFLVMELLEGETLEGRLQRRGRLPAPEALSIVYHLLDVLAPAHAKGIVHRDIKLDNVFITREGQVKVLDFGIARLADASQQLGNQTRTNALLGTPAFMPPEQALGRSNEVDAKTDLWAVGATLFKLLTGRNVHEAATLNEQLVNAATKPAPPIRSILADTPPMLAKVVDTALAFAKADRWADARAMQEAMRPLLKTRDRMPLVRPTSIVVMDGKSSTPLSAPIAGEIAVGAGALGDPSRARPNRLVRLGVMLGTGAGVLVGVWLLWGRPGGVQVEDKPPAVTESAPPKAVATKPPVEARPGAHIETIEKTEEAVEATDPTGVAAKGDDRKAEAAAESLRAARARYRARKAALEHRKAAPTGAPAVPEEDLFDRRH